MVAYWVIESVRGPVRLARKAAEAAVEPKEAVDALANLRTERLDLLDVGFLQAPREKVRKGRKIRGIQVKIEL
jgi:hypothetical protein